MQFWKNPEIRNVVDTYVYIHVFSPSHIVLVVKSICTLNSYTILLVHVVLKQVSNNNKIIIKDTIIHD